MEVTDLLPQKDGLAGCFDFADVEDEDDLSFVLV